MAPALESMRQATHNLSVPAKDVHRIADDLFTSLFILNSQIRFKPVSGQPYWLYRKDDDYRLSLIAPDQWSPAKSGKHIGLCQLHNDLTWTLELSDECRNDGEFVAEITRQRRRFDESMRQAAKLDQVLPVYDGSLPFYPRILASALSYSLRLSMQKCGISGLNFQQAENLLAIAKDDSDD